MGIKKGSKVFISGGTGLLGTAIIRRLKGRGYRLLTPPKSKLNLLDGGAVTKFFKTNRPDYVFMAAAKVGSIAENIKYPVDFLNENILIQKNVFAAAHAFKTKKLLFFSSNCCYPRDCSQPMKEEYFMTGPLEPTNEAYALAKITGMKLCQSYNSQYGTQFDCVIPASLYGPNGHFGTSRAHVVADMIEKLCKVRDNHVEEVTFWGNGSPLREFMFVDDAADAAIFFMKKGFRAEDNKGHAFINIGTGEEISMFRLVKLIAEIVGYKGKISWDASKPNGMPRKLLDSSRCHVLGWHHKTDLEEGIRKTYQWYLKNRIIKPD